METKISGFPSIIMPYEIYELTMGWMNAVPEEVSWRGLADWDEKNFTVTEVFLPVQSAGLANVNVTTAKSKGDLGLWITQCIREEKYVNDAGECRNKLHMHKHPGSDWGSLFESTIDEGTTAKRETRNIEWMMFGRGVASGKFRICLEIFKPIRISIDHLPIFVKYNNLLFLVSEPGVQPTIEEDFSIEIENVEGMLNMAEGKSYFGEIEIIRKEKETIIPPFYQKFQDKECVDYTVGYAVNYSQKIEHLINVKSLSETKVTSDMFFQVQALGGIFTGSLNFQVGPWTIGIENIRLEPKLPIDEKIRKEAERQAKSKVHVEKIRTVARKARYSKLDRIRAGVMRGGDKIGETKIEIQRLH